ncbi:MAG TPA: acylphosphatase [Candidatus Dormibacteraeota bacterium]|nr:acylphosphatase [Candidatus Dormibacteraeota bacterium]
MPPEDPGRLEATVHGSVQGVGFRVFVVRTATRLGLVGWVANRPDGGVECVAEGPRSSLERLEAALREGPPYAEVDRVDVRWSIPSGGFAQFGIRSYGHRGD